MFALMKKTLLATLGVPHKIQEVVNDLARRGETSQGEGAKCVREVMEGAEKRWKKLIDQEARYMGQFLHKVNVATRSDIEKLSEEIQALSKRLTEMGERKK